jgi:hypothetical protein
VVLLMCSVSGSAQDGVALQVRKVKDYTPFPPPQQPSKVDLALASGEYFLSKEKKAARADWEKTQAQADAVAAKKRKREAAFEAPKVCCSVRVMDLGDSCIYHTFITAEGHMVMSL